MYILLCIYKHSDMHDNYSHSIYLFEPSEKSTRFFSLPYPHLRIRILYQPGPKNFLIERTISPRKSACTLYLNETLESFISRYLLSPCFGATFLNLCRGSAFLTRKT